MGSSRKLSRAEIGWILYDVANSAYALIIITTIMPIYYAGYVIHDMPAGTATSDWGFANSAASLLVAFMAPLLGAVADVKQSKKIFLGGFILLGVVSTAMLCLTGPGMRFEAMLLFGLSLIAFAGGNIFYDSLLVDVTTKRRMNWLSGAGYAWGYIGGAAPFVICIVLFALMKDSGTLVMKISFIITALWWGVFSIPVLRLARQKFRAESENRSVADALKNLMNTFRKIKQHRQVVIFLLAYFLYIDGVDTIIRMAIPYSKDIGLEDSMLMFTVLGLQVVAFPFALLYSYLSKRLGAKRLIFVAILVYIVVTFLAFLMPSIEDMTLKTWVFFLLAFLIASSQGGVQALSRSYYGKIIPRKQSAEFFGFYNIFGKFAAIMGPAMIAVADRVFGHVKYGMLSLVFLFIAGGLILIFVKEPESPLYKP
ncbi:MAG: MFS transporter [Victivallales bacterium]|nr:MFS transporter [Victivallales bacterium]